MLKDLLSLNNLGGSYEKFQKNVSDGIKTLAYGLPKTARAHLAGFLRSKILYICSNKLEADEVLENLKGLIGEDVYFLPSKPEVLLSASAFSKELLFQRMTSIYKIAKNQPKVIVATVESIAELFPNRAEFLNLCFEIKKGDNISPYDVVNRLVKCGYRRTELVEGQGQFSLRGDILDVYLIEDFALRIDFFGDNVDRIKEIDVETMKSSGNVDVVEIYPIFDVIIKDSSRDELIRKLKNNVPKMSNEADEQKWSRKVSEYESEIINSTTSSYGEFLPLQDEVATIFDYLDKDTTIIFDDFNKCYDLANNEFFEHKSRYTSLFEGAEILKSQFSQFMNFDKVVDISNDFNSCAFTQFLATDKGFFPRELLEFKVTPISSYQNGNDELARDVNNWLRLGYRVVMCGKDQETAKNLVKNVTYDGVMTAYLENSDLEIIGCVTIPNYIDHGFIIHENKIVIIGTLDLLKKASRSISVRKKKTDAFLSAEVGDFVVHETHGIGYLKSISTIKTGTIVKDYAVVEYKGGDILYVPAEQMDLLVKFSGSDTTPTLSRIGGKDFSIIKEKVKASIKKMAFDLKELYSKRDSLNGYKYQEDTIFQEEFEEAFPFEPTDDQLLSTSEIKKDMTTGKLMDRLLVGDVGYGKTEVAFRACFKAIESGKQVCFLAPTTILSYQHYQTAVKRFEGFGIRIDYLNRFKTEAQQNETLSKLRQGKLDLIIGTHRLLSKDVEFFDLGLLILDEEQRFGVESKELIKNLKDDIDVLSMSATPIPRTLHMSLSGIRDISTIETPPSKRLPVQVLVAEQSPSLLKDAITRELARGGQVFVLYNRVASIYTFAKRIQDLLPQAKMIVAHGKLPPQQLESAIENFVLGNADILVSTTIIENGIDIPKANTMIVIDADKFGLSQLYQLKGRVGRSDKLAYVYYLFQENKVLSETAHKRLQAIMEFTEFGSGFKIAMRDLEIRGSGNVLGREQHGHMEAVGYDMYCKLLRESVDELNGKAPEQANTETDIDISAYISEDYITLSSARMEQYRLISGISCRKDIKDILNTMEDIYGKAPKEIVALCKVSLIRHLAGRLYAKKVYVKENRKEIVIVPESLKNGKLHDMLELHKDKMSLAISDELVLKINLKEKNKALNFIYDILNEIFEEK